MKKERLDKFSIRKLTVGAASVLIGVAFGATTISAEKAAPNQASAPVAPKKDTTVTPAPVAPKKDTTVTPAPVAPKKDTTVTPAPVAPKKDTTVTPAPVAPKKDTTVTPAPVAPKKDTTVTPAPVAPKKDTTVTPAPVAAELAEAKKAAHKALNAAGITGTIFHKAIDNAKNVESVKAYVAEFTYHFTYKGAETTVSTDYVAGSVDKAEQYFRAYASESGFNLDFTYDEATHTFVGTDAKPAKIVYHFQYDDKKGNSIRQDFATTSKETAEMHFRAYASDNALSIDDAHFTYVEATHTFVYKDFESEKGEPEVQPEAPVQKIVFHFQYDDKKGNSIRQDFATTDADTAEMHFRAYASDNALSIDFAHFTYNEATHTFVYKDFESEKGEPEVLPAPAVDVLAEAKKVAHEEFTKAGITGDIFHKAIDAAKTVEGLQAYVAETLKAHKTVEPVTPTPAPVVSGETGIGYLNLDMLSDGFTGTLYVPVVGKDVNCKVRLLDDAGKYTNDYVVTDTTVKALASKVVNGVTFYKVAENRWIPAKFAEVLFDKEVAFKGVAKTFVKGHANYAVAMLDADGKYTGKFLKQGSSFKVFAKKVINGHLCYRLGTQAQWVPARFLVF